MTTHEELISGMATHTCSCEKASASALPPGGPTLFHSRLSEVSVLFDASAIASCSTPSESISLCSRLSVLSEAFDARPSAMLAAPLLPMPLEAKSRLSSG